MTRKHLTAAPRASRHALGHATTTCSVMIQARHTLPDFWMFYALARGLLPYNASILRQTCLALQCTVLWTGGLYMLACTRHGMAWWAAGAACRFAFATCNAVCGERYGCFRLPRAWCRVVAVAYMRRARRVVFSAGAAATKRVAWQTGAHVGDSMPLPSPRRALASRPAFFLPKPLYPLRHQRRLPPPSATQTAVRNALRHGGPRPSI